VIRRAKANRIYLVEEPDEPLVAAMQSNYHPPTKGTNSNEVQTLFKDVSYLLGHVHHEELFDDYARQPLLMKQLSQLGPGVAWFDMDGDGHDELILGAGKGGDMGFYHGNGSGGLEKIATANAWSAPDDTTGLAAWVSSDGRRALLAGLANYESGSTKLPALIRCYVEGANARPNLAAITEVPALRSSPGPLAVADIDGDGDLDLFLGGRVVPRAYPERPVSRIFRQEDGQVVPDVVNSRVLGNVGLVSGAVWSDLDADGYPELILACEWGPVRVFKNGRGLLREMSAAL